MMQKKFEKELERVDGLKGQILEARQDKENEIWWYILQIIFQELGVIIFHYENDKIVLNEKGNPKVDWLGVLANVSTILAKVATIITEYEKFKKQWEQE